MTHAANAIAILQAPAFSPVQSSRGSQWQLPEGPPARLHWHCDACIHWMIILLVLVLGPFLICNVSHVQVTGTNHCGLIRTRC